MIPGKPTAIERASIKFFVVAVFILLIQTFAGGAMAHDFADPKGFFGFDLSSVFPSNVLRSWHLQTAILWITTAYIGGGIFISSILLFRSVRPSVKEPEDREMKTLFLLAAFAIQFFYIPAFFFGSSTNYSTVDTWRFWIIHLGVEGFFEVFATVMVADMFYKLGLVAKQTMF